MKKLIFLILFLPLLAIGQQDSVVTKVSLKGRVYGIVGTGPGGASITAPQIVDSINTQLGGTGWQNSGTTDASQLSSGVLLDARVQQSNVTQHEAALSITKSQIPDFGSYIEPDALSPRKSFIWGPGTKAEFYADYPWPSSTFPVNGIAFVTDSITPKPAMALDSLTDVTMGTPAANSGGTLRVLADPNTDGTYTEVDWTPPGGGGGSTETGISIIGKIDGEIGTDWKNGAQESIDTIQQYATIATLPAITGNEADVYAMVTSEVDSLNGMYGIMSGVWKMMYHISDPRAPFIRVSPNLIDQNNSDFLSGFDIDNTGAIVPDALKFTTQYIPVKKGDAILAHPGARYALYDHNRTLIPIGASYSGGNNHGFGTPLRLRVIDSIVHFVRLDGSLSVIGTSNQIVYAYDHVAGAQSTAWVDYNELYLRDNEHFNWEKEGLIYPKSTNNLYDYRKADYTTGYTNTGVPSTNLCSTGFIPVQEGVPYTTNRAGNSNYTFWDINKNFVSGQTASAVTTPSTAKYMKVGLAQAETFKDVVVMQGFNIRPVYNAETSTQNLQNIEQEPYSICLIGDSIGTESGTYATESAYGGTIANTFRPTVYHNVSVSGKSAKAFALDINTGAYAMPVADLYIITLAANDYNFNTAIGTYGDVHPTQDTYFGSLQKIENDLMALNPNATIVFMTPFPRMGNQETNVLGNVVEDYANAMIYYARMKEHTVIDLFHKVPFNGLNGTIVDTHTKDSSGVPDGRHPTNDGHRIYIWPQIAAAIKSELEKL